MPSPSNDLWISTLREFFASPGRFSAVAEALPASERFRLRDPARFARNLSSLSRIAGTNRVEVLLPTLATGLAASPDPDMALNNLERILSSCTTPSELLNCWTDEPRSLLIIMQLCATSQLLADILRDEALAFCEHVAGGALPAAASLQELEAKARQAVSLATGNLARLGALRLFKRRELLRIGARDILRAASFGEVVREISDLATACVRVALDVCRETVRVPLLPDSLQAPKDWWQEFAVIALGKLGARELNYSSDVDLLFVYDAPWALCDEPPDLVRGYFTRLARALVEALGALTADGGLFRVDMRLRPEGGAGALVRTPAAHVTYWESWAAPWERQALIKASCVAGSPVLGERFVRLAREFVYGKRMDNSGLAEIKAVKRRSEASTQRLGRERDLKLGAGGIRDIEFTVQLLQLIFGASDARVRAPDTLGALRSLRLAGYLSASEHHTLASAYVFLRTLEHQLQLMHGLGTRELPADSLSLDELARRLEFPTSDSLSPGELLLTEYRRHTTNVRELFDKLFAELLEVRDEIDLKARSMVLLDADVQDGEVNLLSEFGFREPKRALQTLRRLAHGTVAAPLPASVAERFADLAPHVLRTAAQTPDPDASLTNFERFCELIGSRGPLYSIMAAEPKLLEMLVRLAGGSASLSAILAAHPEYFDMLMEPAVMRATHTVEDLEEQLALRLDGVTNPDARLATISRFRQRELLRVGVRDLVDEADIELTMQELAAIAEVCLRAVTDTVCMSLLGQSCDSLPFAVIGLGKLAGRELHYNSDLDVLFVWDTGASPVHDPQETYTHLATAIMTWPDKSVGILGPPVRIDARLRPEGQSGPLVRSVAACREYYAERAETWERLVLVRSRLVAGSEAAWRGFQEATEEFVWGRGLTAHELLEITRIKARIEHERAHKQPGSADLKLGPGGINDVEFCVQMLQLAHGRDNMKLRVPNTVGAIRALSSACCFDSPQDAVDLEAAYLFLRRLECRLQILHTWDEGTLTPALAERVAKLLSYDAQEYGSAGERLTDELRRHQTRIRGIYERTVKQLHSLCRGQNT